MAGERPNGPGGDVRSRHRREVTGEDVARPGPTGRRVRVGRQPAAGNAQFRRAEASRFSVCNPRRAEPSGGRAEAKPRQAAPCFHACLRNAGAGERRQAPSDPGINSPQSNRPRYLSHWGRICRPIAATGRHENQGVREYPGPPASRCLFFFFFFSPNADNADSGHVSATRQPPGRKSLCRTHRLRVIWPAPIRPMSRPQAGNSLRPRGLRTYIVSRYIDRKWIGRLCRE